MNLDPRMFPTVTARVMRETGAWGALWRDYQTREKVAVRVEAQLSKSYTPAETSGDLHLDGVLSSAMLRAAPWPLVPRGRADVVPLPLALAWVSPDGWPLWASTNLRPCGARAEGVSYIHKRHPRDRLSLHRGGAVVTTAGSLKDVRIPQPVIAADKMEAWCIACPKALEDILTHVTHIGKKSAIGRGRVLSWSVEPADVSLDWIMQRRPVPVAYCGEIGHVSPRLTGWTPPYWNRETHMKARAAQWTE